MLSILVVAAAAAATVAVNSESKSSCVEFSENDGHDSFITRVGRNAATAAAVAAAIVVAFCVPIQLQQLP